MEAVGTEKIQCQGPSTWGLKGDTADVVVVTFIDGCSDVLCPNILEDGTCKHTDSKGEYGPAHSCPYKKSIPKRDHSQVWK